MSANHNRPDLREEITRHENSSDRDRYPFEPFTPSKFSINSYDVHLAARRARAIEMGEMLRKLMVLISKLIFGIFQRALYVGRGISMIVDLERQHSDLLQMTEHKRKDIGISLCDAEFAAKRIRKRQREIIFRACLGRCPPRDFSSS